MTEPLHRPMVFMPVSDKTRTEIRVVLGLLRMRRAGEIHAVYVDGNRLAYEPRPYQKVPLTWARAEAMVDEFDARQKVVRLKKPASVVASREKAAAR